MASMTGRDSRDGREDRGIDKDGLGDGEIVPADETGGALMAITKGEVDMQVATAHRWPRSITRFKQDALSMVTQDEDTAASCFYTLPRKRKDEKTGAMVPISGPSVRLAEIAAVCWGNLRIEARPIEEGDRFVTAQGTAWDLEKNVLVRVEQKRKITDRDGRRYSDDMVGNTLNSATSVAKRNAIMNVIPRAYIMALDKAARACAIGKLETLPATVAKWMAWFAKGGITQERVLAALEREGLADITMEDVEKLIGYSTALREGTATAEEFFPPTPMAEGTTPVTKAAKARAAAPAPVRAKPTPQEEPPHDADGVVLSDEGMDF